MDATRDLGREIVLTADRLFYQHGIRAIGVNRLIQESGVSKDTFYRYFRSKEKLIAAYLNARHETSVRNFRQLMSTKAGPRERILTIFRDLVSRLQRDTYRGCAFTRMLAEYDNVPELAEIARQHKDWLRREIEAICSGNFSDPVNTSRQLVLLYEGFVARWPVCRDLEDQISLISAVETIIADENDQGL